MKKAVPPSGCLQSGEKIPLGMNLETGRQRQDWLSTAMRETPTCEFGDAAELNACAGSDTG